MVTPANPGRDALLIATLMSHQTAYIEDSVSVGASIIDISGYFTRSGAAYVSPEQEAQRVVPIVQAM